MSSIIVYSNACAKIKVKFRYIFTFISIYALKLTVIDKLSSAVATEYLNLYFCDIEAVNFMSTFYFFWWGKL